MCLVKHKPVQVLVALDAVEAIWISLVVKRDLVTLVWVVDQSSVHLLILIPIPMELYLLVESVLDQWEHAVQQMDHCQMNPCCLSIEMKERGNEKTKILILILILSSPLS